MLHGDFADQAAQETENELNLLLLQQRTTRKPGPAPKGSCYFCNEPFTRNGVELYPSANQKLFCDSDCCEDYEREQRR